MIALFDSGYGGLTVLKPIMQLLPQYDYLYLGDNARSPYGGTSPENIKTFCEEAVEYLFAQGVTLILFACNTASAVALRHVQEKYIDGKSEKKRKILGVLIPIAQKAAEMSTTGRVGVVGTTVTIESGAYVREIEKINPKSKVYTKACPLLVPLIEENWHHKPEAVSVLKKYLRPLKFCNIDTLILGCTHYPLMEKEFRRNLGKHPQILHSGHAIAESLKDYLSRHPEIEEKITKKGGKCYMTTGDPLKFKKFAEEHVGIKIKMPKKVRL